MNEVLNDLDRMERIVQKLMEIRSGQAWATMAELSDWLKYEAVLLPDLVHDVRNGVYEITRLEEKSA